MRPSKLSRHTALNLPRACRQIHSKTATVLYRINIFTFFNVKAAKRWLGERLTVHREAIEHLEIKSGGPEQWATSGTVLKDTLGHNLRSITLNAFTMDVMYDILALRIREELTDFGADDDSRQENMDW